MRKKALNQTTLSGACTVSSTNIYAIYGLENIYKNVLKIIQLKYVHLKSE
jgi:hypothetical protein